MFEHFSTTKPKQLVFIWLYDRTHTEGWTKYTAASQSINASCQILLQNKLKKKQLPNYYKNAFLFLVNEGKRSLKNLMSHFRDTFVPKAVLMLSSNHERFSRYYRTEGHKQIQQ